MTLGYESQAMSDNVDDLSAKQKDLQVSWLRASAEDVIAIDFESPLTGNRTVYEYHEMSNLYKKAVQPVGNPARFLTYPKLVCLQCYRH